MATTTTSTNNDTTTATTVTADKSSTSTNTVVKEAEKEEQAGTVYLSNPSNFLQDCDVWCTLMLTNVTLLHLDTLALMSEIYFRKCKYISMLRVLVAGFTRSKYDPSMTYYFVKLVKRIRGLDSGPKFQGKEATLVIIKEEIDIIILSTLPTSVAEGITAQLESPDLQLYVQRYYDVSDVQNSLQYTLHKVRIMALMSTNKALSATKQEAGRALTVSTVLEGRGVTKNSIMDVYKVCRLMYMPSF